MTKILIDEVKNNINNYLYEDIIKNGYQEIEIDKLMDEDIVLEHDVKVINNGRKVIIKEKHMDSNKLPKLFIKELYLDDNNYFHLTDSFAYLSYPNQDMNPRFETILSTYFLDILYVNGVEYHKNIYKDDYPLIRSANEINIEEVLNTLKPEFGGKDMYLPTRKYKAHVECINRSNKYMGTVDVISYDIDQFDLQKNINWEIYCIDDEKPNKINVAPVFLYDRVNKVYAYNDGAHLTEEESRDLIEKRFVENLLRVDDIDKDIYEYMLEIKGYNNSFNEE